MAEPLRRGLLAQGQQDEARSVQPFTGPSDRGSYHLKIFPTVSLDLMGCKQDDLRGVREVQRRPSCLSVCRREDGQVYPVRNDAGFHDGLG